MKRPPKYEVSEAMRPPPRVVRVPPVAGTARVPTRVGSWDSQLPSSRSVSVATSPATQLVLRGTLAERRCRGFPPGERAVAQRIRERALRDVGPAAGGRGDEST